MEIDNTPLPVDRKPYLINAPNHFPMHDITSKSLVALKRGNGGNYQPLRGTGYFILTDPTLPYYCLLTDGHNLDNRGNYSISGVETTLDMSFGVRYTSEAASRTNPTGYQTVATRAASVTIAEAAVNKQDLPNNSGANWIDYAIIKVPKLALWGVSLVLQGVEFLDEIPTNRLNTDQNKSFYVIHHDNLRPQQISTRNNYAAGFGEYPYSFSMRNLSTLDLGASGAPLVLPKAPKNNSNDHLEYAPVIGLYSGKSIISGDQIFQKLSVIKNSLISACLGKLKKNEYQTCMVVAKVPERVKAALPSLNNLKAGFKNAVDVLKSPGMITISGSVSEATNAANQSITLTDNLIKLINNEGDKEKILQAVTELELNATKFNQKYNAITIVNSTLSSGNQEAYKKTTLESFGILGDYIRYMLGLTDLVKNEKYKPNQYNTISPTNAVPMQMAQIGTLVESVKYSVGKGSTELRKKRETSNQSLQMQAPSEVTDLQKTVLKAVRAINDYYISLNEYESDNVNFFYGVEYFYLNRGLYSNRFLQENFYTEEYRLTEYICEVLDDEIKKTNFLSFLKEGSQNLKEIRAKLNNLKEKKYPKGFITAPISGQPFDMKYYNFISTENVHYIGNSTDGLTWENLSLAFSDYANNFGHLDIHQTSWVNRTDVKGAFESYPWDYKKKQSYGRWYSTRLSITGALDFKNVSLIYHPYFKQYLESNSVVLKKSGELDLKPSATNLTYNSVFNRESLPAEGSAFVVGFGINQFIKEQAGDPSPLIFNNFDAVSYQLDSPELLILARAFKEVTIEHDYSNPQYKIEEETIEGNDQIANSLVLMRTWAEKSMQLTYSVELKDLYKWTFELDLTRSVSPGRYRIRSRSTPIVKGTARNPQYMQTVQPSADHRRYTDVPWVENLAPSQSNLPEQIVKVELNSDGQTYSLTHEGSRAGQYLGRAGYYTQFINGVASGFMIGYSASKEDSEQKWTIRPSSTDGYFQLINTNAVGDVVSITAEYDPDYQASMVHLYQSLNKPEQDWAFESVPIGARVAAPGNPQRNSAEDRTIPTFYPNPVTNQLILNLPTGYEHITLTFSNVSGATLNPPIRQVGTQQVVDVRSLPVGMYFIQVQPEGKPKQVLKFLKQ